VILSKQNGIDTLNYETPRGGSAEKIYLDGDGDNDSFFVPDDTPLQENELFKLSDMRLKEIFNQYAKNYS
jgi:hypothetical protein